MPFSINPGVWPVMITPYTDDDKPDFKAIEGLCNWYIEKGCTGIFAVCQSSEMAFLSRQEKLDIARAVAETVDGRIQVVASGHTADDKPTQFREIEDMIRSRASALMCWCPTGWIKSTKVRRFFFGTPGRSLIASPRSTSAFMSAPCPGNAWSPPSF